MPEDSDVPPSDADAVGVVRRREAASGRVSYGDSVVLHESGQTRVVLVPFFVPRTGRTELAIKVQTFRKGEPPMDWVQVEDKSLSLGEHGARKLQAALAKHLAVAGENQNGEYILIRLNEGTTALGDHDPTLIAKALARVLGQPEIATHLAHAELSDELLRAFQAAIQLNEMRAAVAQLRSHLENGECSEHVYQRWCEAHSWAFGNAYVMNDAVRDISAGDRLDLLLPTVISGYRDIVELKRPDHKVLVWDEAHRNYYFAADVSSAIGQVHRYLDVLHDVAANGLRDHPEVVAYHPRAIVVIGRSAQWPTDKLKALHGLNGRLFGISVMTYDQLLSQGERLLTSLSDRPPTSTPEEEAPPFWDNNDDMPFP